MPAKIQSRELLIEQFLAMKAKHGADPKSVSVGECLAVMETMTGYLLGHDRVLEEMAADLAETMRAVMGMRQELRALRQRFARWQTRP